jgi:endogenous inhibitor of DNA gyrase (YacG/DUF329 family)
LAGKTNMTRQVINCPYCGKMLPKEFWHEKETDERILIKCPRCGIFKPWKDGKLHLPFVTSSKISMQKMWAQVFQLEKP